MGNSFNTAATGQLFLPSASVWNRMQSAAVQAEQAKLDAGQKTAKRDNLPDGAVLVKNATGSPVPQFGILEYSQPVTLPTTNLNEFRGRVVVKGTTPSSSTGSKFCVLTEPLGTTHVGRAVASGIIPVKINVTESGHGYAKPGASVEYLTSSETGTARIIWKESGTGVKWALIEKAIATDENVIDVAVVNCCCVETECLKHDDPAVTTPIKPQFYAFKMPSFRCNCEPEYTAGAGLDSYLNPVRLYETIDPDIWQSDIRQCYGTSQTTVSCTVTADWAWVSDECFNDCVYSSEPAGFPAPQSWGWIDPADPTGHFVTGTPQETNCDPPGDCICDEAALAAAAPPTAPGQTLSIPCISANPANGEWQLVGVDDPDCNCTPLPPDYTPDWDGTGDAPTAQTTCDGFKVIDATGVLVDSFWRQTIVDTRDYYGCFPTKLEFFIGADVVLTYYLEHQCGSVRGFCRQCANSFTIYTCGPTQCDIEPEPKICLSPKISDGLLAEGIGCCTGVQSPETWQIDVTGLAEGTFTGTCCASAIGTFYLGNVDPSLMRFLLTTTGTEEVAWTYFFLGDRYGFYDESNPDASQHATFCGAYALYGWVLWCEGGGLKLRLYGLESIGEEALVPIVLAEFVSSGVNYCEDPITLNSSGGQCNVSGASVTISRYLP